MHPLNLFIRSVIRQTSICETIRLCKDIQKQAGVQRTNTLTAKKGKKGIAGQKDRRANPRGGRKCSMLKDKDPPGERGTAWDWEAWQAPGPPWCTGDVSVCEIS